MGVPLTIPDAAAVEAWSAVDFDALGYADADLERLIARAVAYIAAVTGRVPLTSVPEELIAVAEEAIQRRVEQLALTGTAGSVGGVVSDDGVQSFSVPGYSETRFDRSRVDVKAGVTQPWGALWDLLWLLMTPEMREAWMAEREGGHAPAFGVTEIDWDSTGWGDVPYGWPTAPTWPVRVLGDP